MLTLTPSSWVGSVLLAISAAVQVRVEPARLLPKMVIHAPEAIPLWKLAPFTTEVITGLGPGPVLAEFTVTFSVMVWLMLPDVPVIRTATVPGAALLAAESVRMLLPPALTGLNDAAERRADRARRCPSPKCMPG